MEEGFSIASASDAGAKLGRGGFLVALDTQHAVFLHGRADDADAAAVIEPRCVDGPFRGIGDGPGGGKGGEEFGQCRPGCAGGRSRGTVGQPGRAGGWRLGRGCRICQGRNIFQLTYKQCYLPVQGRHPAFYPIIDIGFVREIRSDGVGRGQGVCLCKEPGGCLFCLIPFHKPLYEVQLGSDVVRGISLVPRRFIAQAVTELYHIQGGLIQQYFLAEGCRGPQGRFQPGAGAAEDIIVHQGPLPLCVVVPVGKALLHDAQSFLPALEKVAEFLKGEGCGRKLGGGL